MRVNFDHEQRPNFEKKEGKMNIIDKGFEQIFKDAYPQGAHPEAKSELRQMYFVGCAFTLSQLGNLSPAEMMEKVDQFKVALQSFAAEPQEIEDAKKSTSSNGEILRIKTPGATELVDQFGSPLDKTPEIIS